MINWESEPDAVAYKPDCQNWYESWWKFVDGKAHCKFVRPEHWQNQGWHKTCYSEQTIKSLIGTTFKSMEDYMTKSNVTAVYKTTDGEVFTELRDAEEHQSKVDIWESIREKFGCYGEVKLNYLDDFLELIKFYEENKQ